MITRYYCGGETVSNPATVLVFYHGPSCLDGFAAAFAVHYGLGSNAKGPTVAHYAPIEYFSAQDTLKQWQGPLENASVIFVDFSVSGESLEWLMLQGVRNVVMLDHHASQADEMEKIAARDWPVQVVAHFDPHHSGAVLAWKFFVHDTVGVPTLIQMVEDRDLWLFKWPETKAVNAALLSREYDFDTWSHWIAYPQEAIEQLTTEGDAILRMRDKDIAAHMELENLEFGKLAGHNIIRVNAPYYVASELGHGLLRQYPDADVVDVWYCKAGSMKHSFRSHKNGLDLSKFLPRFGGGGHPAAGGVEYALHSPERFEMKHAFIRTDCEFNHLPDEPWED